ncbi:general substrate transporter [Leucosporidium creatinivorum]|uniref:General substrate transporter n=1 Tax=Leucosporidium creatinivorum TaxID=106004 RepID=A0A1Y2DPH3_9BASI|nr:general substrate transporter [Leucosporidium creatinivorum]
MAHDDELKGTSSFIEGSINYPAGLFSQPSAPTQTTLAAAALLTQRDKDSTVFGALKKEWRIVLSCSVYLFICMAQGVDSGAMSITNSMPAFLLKFGEATATGSLIIPSMWLSLWTAMIALGNAAGSFSAGWFIDRFGTKKTMWFLCLASTAFISIQVTAESRGQLLVGKMLNGAPQGAFIAVAATYISETAGVRVRSTLLSCMPLMILCGVMLAVGTGVHQIAVFDPWKSYRLLFALQWMLPTLTAFFLIFTPSSPTHLVKKAQPEQARRELERLYGKDDDEVSQRLALIQLAVAIEEAESADRGIVTYADCFRGTDRKRTLTIMAVFAFIQGAGVALLSNNIYFLSTIPGLSSDITFKLSLGFLGLSALANFGGVILLEKFGRRVPFVYGGAVQALLLAILGGLYYVDTPAGQWVLGILFNLTISTAQITTGGPGYTLAGELSSVRLRSKTQSIGFATYYTAGWITLFITPYMFQADQAAWGVRTAWVYAGFSLIGAIVSFFIIPDTRGLSYADIDIRYTRRIAPRAFASCDVSDKEVA